jgi:hypothetical protein
MHICLQSVGRQAAKQAQMPPESINSIVQINELTNRFKLTNYDYLWGQRRGHLARDNA